jgi:hypothetical protein
MLNLLLQPYPIAESNLTKSLFQSLLTGIFVTFVLIIFQPFGAYNWQHTNKMLLLTGYGFVASITTFLNFYVFVKLFPALFAEKNWTVGKEIVWNLIPILLGGFLSTVYGYVTGAMPFSITQISYMMVVVFLVGFFPAVILVLLKYIYLIRKYRPQPYEKTMDSFTSGSIESEDVMLQPQKTLIIELFSDNEKDKLTVEADTLLFIESSDNYCTVNFLKDGKVCKTLLRSSLSRLQSQLDAAGIVRCHRSYIVNFSQVKSVSGNAQGYKLHFHKTESVVPVARSYSSVLKQHLLLC